MLTGGVIRIAWQTRRNDANIVSLVFPDAVSRFLTRRDVVFAQGDVARDVYFLADGAVRLSRINDEGKEVTICFLGAGDLFGEDALLGDRPRDTTAICMGPATIAVLGAQNFTAILASDPSLVLEVALQLCRRISQTTQAFEELAFASVEARLASILRRLASRFGRQTDDGVKIVFSLTHAELASIVGSTRETVSMHLADLMRRQLLRIDQGYFVVSNAWRPGDTWRS